MEAKLDANKEKWATNKRRWNFSPSGSLLNKKRWGLE
jgi:hypothetical protein